MLYTFRATVDGQNVTLTDPEKNPLSEKYEAIVILTAPLRTDAVSSADQPFVSSSPLSLKKDSMNPAVGASFNTTATPPLSGIRQNTYAERPVTPSRVSIDRGASPVMPAVGLSAPAVSDNLSILYHEKAKRDERRSSTSGDIYVDVNRDAYQRIMQGEQIQLVFEEGGNFITSSFVLVEGNSQLYINFHQFNETKPLPVDKLKILSQIFEIKGSLSDFIKACKPAQMVPKNGGYVIVNKGVLILAGAGQ